MFIDPGQFPAAFVNSQTGKPFERCLVCEQPLPEASIPYIVEKAFIRYEKYGLENLAFEYAMCMDCGVQMHGKMSTESRGNMEKYFSSHFNPALNIPPSPAENINWEEWVTERLKFCALKGTLISEEQEYMIYGMFSGQYMNTVMFPYAVGGTAMDELMALLSNETIDLLNDFTEQYFSGPPEVRELLKRGKPVLI